MPSQAQQSADNTSASSRITTALEPEARQIISPTTQSIAKAKWIVAQIFGFIEPI